MKLVALIFGGQKDLAVSLLDLQVTCSSAQICLSLKSQPALMGSLKWLKPTE